MFIEYTLSGIWNSSDSHVSCGLHRRFHPCLDEVRFARTSSLPIINNTMSKEGWSEQRRFCFEHRYCFCVFSMIFAILLSVLYLVTSYNQMTRYFRANPAVMDRLKVSTLNAGQYLAISLLHVIHLDFQFEFQFHSQHCIRIKPPLNVDFHN